MLLKPNHRLRQQQRIALRHHCRLAGETLQPRFRWVVGAISIVLTVNSGHE